MDDVIEYTVYIYMDCQCTSVEKGYSVGNKGYSFGPVGYPSLLYNALLIWVGPTTSGE